MRPWFASGFCNVVASATQLAARHATFMGKGLAHCADCDWVWIVAARSGLTAGRAGLFNAVATGASGGGAKPAEKSPKSSGSRGSPAGYETRSQHGSS